MPYVATVLRVMIASPSDVPEARDAVEKAVHGWNDANAMNKSVILQPWRWETSAVPVMGAHPQKLINAQGVDDSDIVFALFGGRLGSPTPDAISGTAEEVDRALELGKPVHLYFSTAPLPNDIDTAQLDALRAFKKDMQDRGLLGEFNNPGQLNHEVWKAIEHDIVALNLASTHASLPTPSGVDFLVQPHQEREVSGMNSKGAPRYTTKRWLDVSNAGSTDAENVTFEAVHDGYMNLMGPKEPTTIHKGQSRRLPVQYAAGGSDGARLRIRWTEDGEDKERDFHVG
ncbi:DUF4062 domain-containing protein [Actinomyces massiliensis]|jgi:hypothetical protein|uniref:DUF4062 domain-containing protein n=1 Tax=Actinomyces massiliensis F0489 TaxID=1125718 RepID=J1GS34_9ACTO|nr:DUF4062 domain-containing protein [Actinomyces massiliensis]EJF35698.1 hypothetical protein HMPREF1318_1276 [Actinomyces massiliensis F0489]WLD70905.1 DUF4062 domain-containing protein [Actinomyces massiliensis]